MTKTTKIASEASKPAAPRKRRGWALTEALLAPAKDGRFY